MSKPRAWADRSPQERADIAINRNRASYLNPFKGKNTAQRYALHRAFNAMATSHQKLGIRL